MESAIAKGTLKARRPSPSSETSSADRNKKEGEPVRTHHETTSLCLKFNVMPNRSVQEDFSVHTYKVWPGYLEANFGRKYTSEMIDSPDHLIFLTGLVHMQKSIYVYMCYHLGIPYDPFAPEKLKIWPTKVVSEMRRLLDKQDVCQTLELLELRQLSQKKYWTRWLSNCEDAISLTADTIILVL